MKALATMFFSIVAALAVLVPAAPGALPSSSQGLSARERAELIARYPQTRSLAPSPEALAARAPDLVERYAIAHPSTVATGNVVTRSLAPSPEALAARASDGREIMTRGLAPSPEALAARTSTSDDGFGWDGLSVSVGLLFASLLLATCAVYAVRYRRERYASV